MAVIIMAKIEGTELVIKAVGHWLPRDLAFIESLNYSCQTELEPSRLRLTGLLQPRVLCSDGWPSKAVRMYRLIIEFSGIRHFYVKEQGGTASQVMGFDIVDVSDRGWEDVSFEVEDYEHERIGLRCKEIRVVSVALAE